MSNHPLEPLILGAWKRKNSLFYLVLVPLSWLFRGLVWFRRKLYQINWLKVQKLPVPVIVVGNIHLGGSGKTPAAIWLVEQLKKQGLKPGVISRGYRGSVREAIAVGLDSDASLVGDEPLLIAQRTASPVWVGADRVAVGRALLHAHPECNVLISDDGLQHYRLHRDMEIVVVDIEAVPLEGAYLLPAGPLRESPVRLKQVDAVLSHGQPALPDSFAMTLVGEIFYNLQVPQKHATAADFKRQSVMAIAGIGRPERFFEHLGKLGLTFATASFDDHHAYTRDELDALGADVLLMTEKDAVKCAQYAKPNFWVLPVEANIDVALIDKVLAKIARK